MAYRTAAQAFGGFFSVVALICLVISLATNYWVYIQVDKEQLNLQGSDTGLAYFHRNRGLFLECFQSDDAKALIKANKDLAASMMPKCLKHDLTGVKKDVSYNADVKTRSDLLLVAIIFLCFAAAVIVAAFIVFGISICKDPYEQPQNWALKIKWAGILMFVAAFTNAVGMAFFHGAEYMETQRITSNGSDSPYPYYFRMAQPSSLQDNTTRFYSWSYGLSWLAVVLEVVAALLLFLCGECCRPRSEKQMYEASTIHSARSFGQRNKAYEYAEGTLPPVIYTGQPQVINDGGYYDHFKGRHFDPYRGGPAHQEFTPQYNFDDGGWRWQ